MHDEFAERFRAKAAQSWLQKKPAGSPGEMQQGLRERPNEPLGGGVFGLGGFDLCELVSNEEVVGRGSTLDLLRIGLLLGPGLAELLLGAIQERNSDQCAPESCIHCSSAQLAGSMYHQEF